MQGDREACFIVSNALLRVSAFNLSVFTVNF